ncbi:MAG: YebC/PmpR family DNA-binding transcriptional regulator [Candidatus Roizmanbacteria bacterium]|nr:YebC/PmpR family DNA-binding transcriptional regulator [Candidatus Roizmanbacteria bacterium]
MSGHNKWSKIKNKKAVEDAKRSKLFSMLVRTITMESRATQGDINHPHLRTAIEKARGANMPMENIERAVARGIGVGENSYTEVLYETYGPGGSAIIIEAITDNKNRTAAELRHLLSQEGTELARPGSALWAFHKEAGIWSSHTTSTITDTEGKKLSLLVEKLEEHPDVNNVYTNAQ